MGYSPSHQLIEIPFDQWTELRDLFTTNWPEHILGYSIVNNFIEWKQKSGRPEIRNLKFYSLDGDWKKDGTFLAIDRYQLFLYSLQAEKDHTSGSAEAPVSRLETALGLLDWTNGFKVSSFSSKHRLAVVRVVESKRLEREFDSETIFYHLPRHHAAELPLLGRDDVILKPLSDCDAPLADSLWPNRHSGSLFFLRRLIKWNPNVGAYKRLPDGSEILMGWCFILQSGALGALQVREEYQGMGIGTLITIEMCRILSEQNKDPFAYVGNTNFSSRRLFEKLNFNQIGAIFWLRTFPVGKSISLWDKDADDDL